MTFNIGGTQSLKDGTFVILAAYTSEQLKTSYNCDTGLFTDQYGREWRTTEDPLVLELVTA
jgi:hypothetical protein